MQITQRLRKPPALQTLRQPSVMRGSQADQNLIFVYPMLYDDSLKHEINLLRAFFTIDVIGQIKTSNVLNITSSASQIGMVGSGDNAINPAQEVRQSLWTAGGASEVSPSQTDYDSRYNRMEYQEQINRFMEFTANQIRNNPRYTPLLPIMSSLVIENLVTIPLIIGTKQYSVEPTILYWILLAAIATGTRLDKPANIWKLKKIINNIPPDEYINYMFSDRARKMLGSSAGVPPGIFSRMMKRITPGVIGGAAGGAIGMGVGLGMGMGNIGAASGSVIGQRTGQYISKKSTDKKDLKIRQGELSIDRYINSNTARALGTMAAVVDSGRWSIETGGIETRDGLTLDDLPKIQTYTQSKTYNAAISSFNTYIGNIVPALIFDLENILGPTPINIDMVSKTNQFIQDISELSLDKIDVLSNIVTEALRTINIDAEMRVPATLKKLEEIADMCEENRDIGLNVGKHLEELDKSHLQELYANDQTDLNNFLRAINKTSASFSTFARTYEAWLMDIADSPDAKPVVSRALKSLEKGIKALVHKLIYETYPAGNPPMFEATETATKMTTGISAGVVASTSIIGPTTVLPLSDNRYATIAKVLSGKCTIGQLSNFVTEFYEVTSSIIYFLFLYNFFSYTCIFMKDIDIDIETQQQDALEFPNYCFVVPIEIIKALFAVQRAKVFKEILKAKKIENIPTNVDDVGIGWSDIKRIISLIVRQLAVPNIIVVDKAKSCIYYKFMYMQTVNKLNTKSLENYVKSQEDALPGF